MSAYLKKTPFLWNSFTTLRMAIRTKTRIRHLRGCNAMPCIHKATNWIRRSSLYNTPKLLPHFTLSLIQGEQSLLCICDRKTVIGLNRRDSENMALNRISGDWNFTFYRTWDWLVSCCSLGTRLKIVDSRLVGVRSVLYWWRQVERFKSSFGFVHCENVSALLKYWHFHMQTLRALSCKSCCWRAFYSWGLLNAVW